MLRGTVVGFVKPHESVAWDRAPGPLRLYVRYPLLESPRPPAFAEGETEAGKTYWYSVRYRSGLFKGTFCFTLDKVE